MGGTPPLAAGEAPPGKRWPVPAIPAAVSLLLSSLTIGSHPYWQDSGFYLSAVHELGILYPPGFVLYLLLCKGWTLLLAPVCGFTLAVHLFSAACAALAAGALALAAEAFTRNRGAAIATGILAATGYTWGFAAVYAKGYALYYLLLSLLLWRLIRKDFTGSALLVGLAWAAHPSAGLFAPPILAYLWVHRRDLRALGAARLAGLALLALAAALGPILFLPALSAREPAFALGDPRTFGDLVDYALGRRFTMWPGTWGFDGSRWSGAARFLAEEFLLAGTVCLAVGVVDLWRRDRGWLAGAALWTLPFAFVAILFKIEGQYDLWLVAVYLGLYLVAARGIAALSRRSRWAAAATAGAAVLSAIPANLGDLRLLRGDLVERLGRCYLQNLEPGAVLIASSDDAVGLVTYLQRVGGYRTDICLVNVNALSPRRDWEWYVPRLRKRYPDLHPPDYASVGAPGPSDVYKRLQAAFVNANARGTRSLYLETDPDPSLLRPGLGTIPAGLLWRVTVEGRPGSPDLAHWSLPLQLEDAAALRSDRPRGQVVARWKDGMLVIPQSYRDRLLSSLLEARQREAYLHHLKGTPEGYRRAVELYGSMVAVEPAEARRLEVLFPLATSYMGLNLLDRAEPVLRQLLGQPLSAAMESASLWYLADVCEATRRADEARELLRRALRRPDLDPGMRAKIDARLARR